MEDSARMKDSLKNYIVKQVASPKEGEIEEILSIFREKHYQKGDFFKKPFTTGSHVAFLGEGTVRTIIYRENGDEVTVRVRQKNSFLADPFRLEGMGDSPSGIECLEDLTMLVAPIDRFTSLLETNLALNIVVRIHLKEQLLEIGKNYYQFITGTARERYEFILENNPELLKKIPLRFIASLIGVTSTQLSRIRKKNNSKKTT